MTALALSEASARVLARAGGGLRPGGAQAGAGGRPRSGGLHRTGAPVLRDSIEAGTFEDVFFAMPAPGWRARRARERGPCRRPNVASLR